MISPGARYAIFAYFSWGLLPLYWKLLQSHTPFAILAHRIFWSWVFYTLWRRYREGSWDLGLRISATQWRSIVLSSLLIGGNWWLYIYGVNSGQVVETSLGYFINPLLNILVGAFILKEKLERSHKVAFLLALIGVGVISWGGGKIPWIAITLASSFCIYGLVRKRLVIPSFQGGQLESFLLILPVGIGAWLGGDRLAPFSTLDLSLLVGAGLVTGLPLIWFAEAARRLPYFMIGFFQYLAPTLQFLTAVLIFREPLSLVKLSGFVLIWSAIALVLFATWRRARRATRLAKASTI